MVQTRILTEPERQTQAGTETERRAWTPERVLDVGYAAAILLAPIAFLVGATFEPANHIPSGAENIARNLAANPTTNSLHIAGFVLASFLLPISMLGMARLAAARAPWLATIGGALGLIGWLPLPALAAQDDLTLQMARLGNAPLLGTLWERFNADATMTLYLLVYIVGHLLAYVVLPIALRRARAIAAWPAWLLAASSPLTIALFVTHQPAFFAAVCVALVLPSIVIAAAALRGRASRPAAG